MFTTKATNLNKHREYIERAFITSEHKYRANVPTGCGLMEKCPFRVTCKNSKDPKCYNLNCCKFLNPA